MIAPTGLLAEPIAILRDMIAASAAFQSWCGVTGEADPTAAALERVHLLVAPADAQRPFALVDFGEFTRERMAVTNRVRFQTRSSSNLVLWLQADADQTLEEPDATVDFSNHVGALWSDIETAAGVHSPATLAVNEMELIVAPARVEIEKRDTAGDYFECALACYFTRTPSNG